MSKITEVENSRVKSFNSANMGRVKPGDSLIKRRRDVNHAASLQHQYEECERTGRIDNFRITAGVKGGELSNRLAADSDVYKWIEAVAFDVGSGYPPEMKEKADEVIDLIEQSQEGDGYLFTPYIVDRTAKRWSNLVSDHELYCGGHLVQAAVAYHRATGEKKLLDVAAKWADCAADRFGPNAHPGTGGHPEVEMALVELYRETDEKKYLKLSEFFIEQRGKGVLNGDMKIQDHLPVREQSTMEGHAVRQLYLLCGIADLYSETGDKSLIDTLEKQWSNFTGKKMAVTGGAGARYQGERFGLDYEIPGRTGYYETCAAIASFMWNWRMLQITGTAGYADVMEKALYNGILSAMSLDGKKYFYTNPLEHDGCGSISEHMGKGPGRGSNRRSTSHWDRTACCPPNMARLLAGLTGYIYGLNEDSIYVHHYLENEATLHVQGADVVITQKTRYPWEGEVELSIDTPGELEFSLKLRIPGWSKNVHVNINGREPSEAIEPETYFTVTRRWSRGDRVVLNFPMPVEKVAAHPRVTDNSGCVALRRGPVVYCTESTDHPGIDIYNLSLLEDAEIGFEYVEDLLGGVVVLRSEAALNGGTQELYEPLENRKAVGRAELTAVPYFAWANRTPGAMRVWMPIKHL